MQNTHTFEAFIEAPWRRVMVVSIFLYHRRAGAVDSTDRFIYETVLTASAAGESGHTAEGVATYSEWAS